MNIRTQWTNRPITPGKKITGPSITVPDMAMSAEEIMTRYTRGLPLIGEKVPLYLGENDELPDVRRLDLAELEELRNKAKEDYLAKKEKLETAYRERLKKQGENEADKKRQAREDIERKAAQKEADVLAKIERITGSGRRSRNKQDDPE